MPRTRRQRATDNTRARSAASYARVNGIEVPAARYNYPKDYEFKHWVDLTKITKAAMDGYMSASCVAALAQLVQERKLLFEGDDTGFTKSINKFADAKREAEQYAEDNPTEDKWNWYEMETLFELNKGWFPTKISKRKRKKYDEQIKIFNLEKQLADWKYPEAILTPTEKRAIVRGRAPVSAVPVIPAIPAVPADVIVVDESESDVDFDEKLFDCDEPAIL